MQNSCDTIFPRNMACFRSIIVNILFKGDNKDNNNFTIFLLFLTVGSFAYILLFLSSSLWVRDQIYTYTKEPAKLYVFVI
jgi:hypothetical protein